MTLIEAPYLIYLGDTKVPEFAKTGIGIVYWRKERCIGQLREEGCKADLGIQDMSIQEAISMGAKTLVIGTSAPGGQLPANWIQRLIEAMEAGLDIASGLHIALKSIPELAEAAKNNKCQLHDIRLSGGPHPIANGLPRSGHRLLTVGTDCAIGKKYAALAIHKGLVDRGVDATFRATGQTGVLIDGHGYAIDAIVSDFLAGAVETLTPANHPDHWDIIEGQGSIIHPAYSGVSLGLLHGAQPDAFVVCHEAGREELSGFPGHKTPKIENLISMITEIGGYVSPHIRCVGICLNTSKLSEQDALKEIETLGARHNLPVCDPVRFNVNPIIDYITTEKS